MNSIFTARADSVTFRSCWRGYDRAQVDQYLRRTAADRQRLEEDLAQLEVLTASYRQNGLDATIEAARREARDIRATTQQEAARLLIEAADQAAALQLEQLDTSRRELDRQTTLRCEVASCLETSIAALRTATERLSRSGEAGSEVTQLEPHVATPASAGALRSLRLTRMSRRVSVLLAFVAIGGSLLAVLMNHSDVREMPVSRVPTSTGSHSVSGDASRRGNYQAPSPSASPAAPIDGIVLTLTAVRSCWLGTSVDGSQHRERLLKADETIMLRAYDEAVLKVGDAAALSVLINNQLAKPLGAAGEVVTRRITRTNFLSFLAAN
jgi:DivIVA domain-containing protein